MKIFLVFLLLTISFFLPKSAWAASEFTTIYEVKVSADIGGKTHVSQNISLINKLSHIYASSYSLSVEKAKIENVQASDRKGQLKVNLAQDGETSTISFEFNEQVVGLGKTLNFNLSYDSSDMAKKSGQVWEIMIPKLASPLVIDEYNLVLSVPSAFGKLAYVSPDPLSQRVEEKNQLFTFNKTQMASTGVIAAFGDFQIFDFNLTYNLENPDDKTVIEEVALPPDTSYQKINYNEIVPLPDNVTNDQDGNWLASFSLKPKESLTISASGQVKIFAEPIASVKTTQVNLASFLEPKPYWEVGDPTINSLGKKLKTAKAIHRYVVDTLEYDYSRARVGAKRMGAKDSLKNPDRAICMEYTDLFISLARAAGIPARELNGYAFTANSRLRPLSLAQDVLHAWPEYWDDQQKRWIQIDPTWEDTTGGIDYFSKLDLDHFVFAIHGQDSSWPLPAGSYKKTGLNQKNVVVTFGKPKEVKTIPAQVDFDLPKILFSEIGALGKIVIANVGQEAIHEANVKFSAEGLKIQVQGESYFETLPPFSHREIPLKIEAKRLFTQNKGEIKVFLNGQEFAYNMETNSLILKYLLPLLGGIIGAITIFIIARKARRLSFQGQKRNDPLHRESQ